MSRVSLQKKRLRRKKRPRHVPPGVPALDKRKQLEMARKDAQAKRLELQSKLCVHCTQVWYEGDDIACLAGCVPKKEEGGEPYCPEYDVAIFRLLRDWQYTERQAVTTRWLERRLKQLDDSSSLTEEAEL